MAPTELQHHFRLTGVVSGVPIHFVKAFFKAFFIGVPIHCVKAFFIVVPIRVVLGVPILLFTVFVSGGSYLILFFLRLSWGTALPTMVPF